MSETKELKIERTDFEKDWSDLCPHCGKAQQEHRVTHGPCKGVLLEHRMPCEPEKKKMQGETKRMVVTAKVIILIGWIIVPLAYLVLQQFVAIFGWIAFGIGIFQLGVATIKYFWNPEKWIPGYKAKKEKEQKESHYIYHCERNPEGFARLRAENFDREEKERSGR